MVVPSPKRGCGRGDAPCAPPNAHGFPGSPGRFPRSYSTTARGSLTSAPPTPRRLLLEALVVELLKLGADLAGLAAQLAQELLLVGVGFAICEQHCSQPPPP